MTRQIVEIAKRGQLTIPKRLREELGIEDGQRYAVSALEGGVLMLTPQRGRAVAALNQLREELATQGATLEEMLAQLRRMRESDG